MNAERRLSGSFKSLNIRSCVFMLCLAVCFGLYFQHSQDRLNTLSNTIVELNAKIDELEGRHVLIVKSMQNVPLPKKITVTAYTSSVNECDSDPSMTASMTKTRPGIIAVSRDLFEDGWVFGKKVYIENHGIYEIADLMNKKYENRVDIFIGHKKKANKFGKKELLVALLPDGNS